MQIKSELFSPETISALEDKKLLSLIRVYSKSTATVQTEGCIMAEGPL